MAWNEWNLYDERLVVVVVPNATSTSNKFIQD